MTQFNITLVEKTEKDGKEKNYYTTVGIAFHNEESNTISCKLRPGIAISGDFVLFEKQAKDDSEE